MAEPIHLENRTENNRRLFSPTAGRNCEPISEQIGKFLSKGARVLEIGSGTGEHAVACCTRRPDIIWQPTDPDRRSRLSQNAWRHHREGQIHPSLSIDTTHLEWWGGLDVCDAVFCANMIHIAPWEATVGLAAGAGQILSENGLMVLYGPFLEGRKTAQSNLKFDKNLKARNPKWGVRSLDSVKHIFADVGLNLQTRIEMPAENRILVFSKA